MGYLNLDDTNSMPAATRVNLESSGSAGSSNTYKIRVINSSSVDATITLGVSVGLDYNDLSLPSNGNLFLEYQLTGAEEVIYKAESEDSFDSLTEREKKEAITHYHNATKQTDALTDYRYVGSEPNNYVSFSNEVWRIIGVFTVDDGNGNLEERLKIIRDESIGNYSWDNKDTTTGAEDYRGKNNWSDARVNYLLNPGHESESVGGVYIGIVVAEHVIQD